MKKKLALIPLAFFLVFNANMIFAQSSSSKLDEKIRRYISYPYLAGDDLYGKVSIRFDVNDKGKINVKNIESTNPILIDFVKRRLDKITLPSCDEKIGTTQNLVLNFKKEGL